MQLRFPLFTGVLATMLVALAGCTSQARGDGEPLPDADERPTPLHFGLYVTPDPAQNPIDPPERFTGFHAATDFEIFEGEEDQNVPIYAVCEGPVVFSGRAEGYGGLIRQHCTIDDQEVAILYGHLAIDSLAAEGIDAKEGQMIGILGEARSDDTDGSRKHLHLGIVKGHTDEVRGYVQDETDLELFLNPREVLGL